MPFADRGGFRLHYMLEGESPRPVVMLSNSLGADVSMWDGQVDALLQGGFRVLRYDTRGHGRSEAPDDLPSLADLGEDVVSLLDGLEIERAHVCGVSLGGMTAMWVGLHAPERTCSLVLSNTAAKIGNVDSWNERIATVREKGLAAVVDAVTSRWFTAAYRARTEEFGRQQAMLLRCPARGYVGASAAIREADLRESISGIRVPTLVLSGAEDEVTPPSDGRALQAAIAGAEFEEVPGAHLANIENPAAYNRVLLAFLQAQPMCSSGGHKHG